MNAGRTRKRRWFAAAASVIGLIAAVALSAGRMLVVDEPRPSDVILVLAGETDRRPELALQLLAQGYARRVVVDVPEEARVFGFTEVQLAEKYFQEKPQAASLIVCPIRGLSTKDESHDAARCLARERARTVLLVTSDFHTRRALSVFLHEIPGLGFSVAAVRDDRQFGIRWWSRRQWAKICLDEWMRLFWWKVVDEWR
jgi:hypothetical protein